MGDEWTQLNTRRGSYSYICVGVVKTGGFVEAVGRGMNRRLNLFQFVNLGEMPTSTQGENRHISRSLTCHVWTTSN